MKKILALLLAAVMCLSLAACGGEDAPDAYDNGGTHQNEQLGGEVTGNGKDDGNDEFKAEADLKSVLMNQGTFWSYVNRPTMGVAFLEDGTTSNPDGMWELMDNIVTVTLEDGSSDSYEIKDINGDYYLVGNRDMLYGVQTSVNDIPFKEVEITMENWQEYFEFASASKEITDVFGEPTGEIDEVHCLKLKDEYFRLLVRFNSSVSDVRMKYIYGGSERESIMSDYWYEMTGCYFGESGIDSKIGFEMVKVQGTLCFIDGIE